MMLRANACPNPLYIEASGPTIKDETAPVFLYKRWSFALDEFERIENEPELKTWHGIKSETAFSGVLIRISGDGEQYQVDYYYG